MKPAQRTPWRQIAASLIVLAWMALPAAAAQEAAAPDPADSLTGQIFRWLNFALVFGAIAYFIVKVGAPYFRQNSESISDSIRKAGEERAAAERELNEANQKLAKIDLEVQDLRREAANESATQAGRIRALTLTEVERIGQAERAEINAAERAAALELRAAAARLATERAAELVRERLNAATEAGLFRTFVVEIERSAS